MLTREKVVLAMLQEAARPLGSLVLTKLLFLLRNEAGLAKRIAGFYDFVPYKFGPYSFVLYNDLAGLKRSGYLEPSGDNRRLGRLVDPNRDWMSELHTSISGAVRCVYLNRGGCKPDELLRHVYSNYPWFASKSELKHLIPRNISHSKPARPSVYISGYQQRTVDAFLSGLLARGISGIIDVRSNPVSRNYGFAGRTLATLSGKVGLQYKHFPQLGIPSTERNELHSEKQYDVLFMRYCNKVLPRESDSVAQVAALMRTNPSALLCYEADPSSCHRSHLAGTISSVNGLEVIHLP